MNWRYRDVTVLGLSWALATAPAFSQALAQASDPLGAIGAAGQVVSDEAVEALEALGQDLAPPADSPPASVISQAPATGQPASPPFWYFDRPAAPLSPYSGQPRRYALQPGELASLYAVVQPDWRFDRPAAPLSPYSGQPHPYVGQASALPYADASAAQPAPPRTAYATRPLGYAN